MRAALPPISRKGIPAALPNSDECIALLATVNILDSTEDPSRLAYFLLLIEQ
jgi:hypothetical protein